MERIDFESGNIPQNILGAALPMLVAQILNLLYNIVERIYIARIPQVGTAALGAVGLCFPLIVIISTFANLFGSGGAPLFSIHRGQKQPRQALSIMDTSFTMLCGSGIVLMTIGLAFARPLLTVFGASADAMAYALPYLQLYLIGTLPSMLAVGMNPFINAQGIPRWGCSRLPSARLPVCSSTRSLFLCLGLAYAALPLPPCFPSVCLRGLCCFSLWESPS